MAALWVRETLQAVGVDDADRFRLVDLKPPQKTRRLNRQGRTLTITPELLITSTAGMSHPWETRPRWQHALPRAITPKWRGG